MRMDYLYALTLLLSALLAGLAIYFLKSRMLSLGIKGRDINKEKKPLIPEAGGILLVPGIVILIVSLVEGGFINPLAYVFLFVAVSFATVGFFDDGFRIFKKETGWEKYLINRALVLFLVTLPFSYFVMPALVGCGPCYLFANWVLAGLLILVFSSFANSFAGLNGWEVGSSAIVLAGLVVMLSFSEKYTSTLVTLVLVFLGAQISLLFFNRFPARIFPGDSGTLLMGSVIGASVIFLDPWHFAFLLIVPHIVDIILKFSTNAGDVSQKKERPYVLKDGKLHVPPSGKLDFAKALLKLFGPMTEKRLVCMIQLIVLANTVLWTSFYILLKVI